MSEGMLINIHEQGDTTSNTQFHFNHVIFFFLYLRMKFLHTTIYFVLERGMKMATIKVINLINEIVKDVKSIKFERNKEEGTHTNIGTNQCTYCKKVFSRKDNLTRHNKTVDCNRFKEKTVQIRKRKCEVRGKHNSKKSKLMSEDEAEAESKSLPSTISAHNFSVDKILAMFTNDDEIENITAILWGYSCVPRKIDLGCKKWRNFLFKRTN